MIRRTQLNLEPLEGRSLLSGLAYSLTTNQPAYPLGKPIVMSFQVTNVSTRAITVDDGPSIDGFIVSHDGAEVWRSNSGVNPMIVVVDTLQPGQSLTRTAAWDGIPDGGTEPVSGTFVITNELDPQATMATVTISSSTTPSTPPDPARPSDPHAPDPARPSDPETPDPTPVSSPPPTAPVAAPSSIELSVTTNHPLYRKGHPVRMSVSLRNISQHSIALASTANRAEFTVFEGSTAVWHWRRIARRKIEPGQIVKVTAVWNGRSHQAGVAIAPGTYTLEADAGGDSGSSMFRVIG